MPAGQPFTVLCRALAQPRTLGVADLHIHTTASDGVYTPAQVVDLARRSGLAAIAITDHDTIAGVAPAQRAAGQRLEVIAGVEISCEHHGAELHVLGHFVDLENQPLLTALRIMQLRRVERFHEMIQRLQGLGVRIDAGVAAAYARQSSPGRRHVAELLVQARQVANVREAFQRWLGDQGRVVVPKVRLPAGEAIALVRGAGGVAAWAHPPYDSGKEKLVELRAQGLQAVEAEFPSCRAGFGRQLRTWAGELQLAITGGSDCHGPDSPPRGLGSSSMTRDELDRLRRLIE